MSKNLRQRKKKERRFINAHPARWPARYYSKLARVEARKSEAAIWRANEREREREREEAQQKAARLITILLWSDLTDPQRRGDHPAQCTPQWINGLFSRLRKEQWEFLFLSAFRDGTMGSMEEGATTPSLRVTENLYFNRTDFAFHFL